MSTQINLYGSTHAALNTALAVPTLPDLRRAVAQESGIRYRPEIL